MAKKTWLGIALLISFGAGSLLIHSVVFASTKPKEPSFAKNLQVLTFLKSKQQLKDWMHMFKTSLGVNCDFCHNTNNFASDAKPPKRIARVMLKMLLKIRKEYFSFPNAKMPTCYTCHRGQKVPEIEPASGFKGFTKTGAMIDMVSGK